VIFVTFLDTVGDEVWLVECEEDYLAPPPRFAAAPDSKRLRRETIFFAFIDF
jgi:hypothetical protein